MACKHRKIKGDTTKYFVCGITEKSVDDYKCKECPLKIEDNSNLLNDLFGGIFGKGFGE